MKTELIISPCSKCRFILSFCPRCDAWLHSYAYWFDHKINDFREDFQCSKSCGFRGFVTRKKHDIFRITSDGERK